MQSTARRNDCNLSIQPIDTSDKIITNFVEITILARSTIREVRSKLLTEASDSNIEVTVTTKNLVYTIHLHRTHMLDFSRNSPLLTRCFCAQTEDFHVQFHLLVNDCPFHLAAQFNERGSYTDIEVLLYFENY